MTDAEGQNHEFPTTDSRPSRQAEPSHNVSRRTLLKRGGAIAGATGLLGATQLTSLADHHVLDIDVACNGGTMAIARAAGSDPDGLPQRGDTFIIQGRMYPGGTIAQGLTGPAQAGSIGTWICRGWFYFDVAEFADGAAPHVITTQLYLFDNGDGLVSDGIEGGLYSLRPVVGGYGAYASARGVVSEEDIETNDTLINLGAGVLAPAPNIEFKFQLA